MTKVSMALTELAEKGADVDILRDMLQFVAERMMNFEMENRCGAPYNERGVPRENSRNGYRERLWETRAGAIDLRIPKLRKGSYFPATICSADPEVLTATRFREIELADEQSVAQGIAWWEELTGAGGEGMVVKPLEFCARDKRGLIQPALKVRGREYLRIVYGPEYTLSENMARLRERSVGSKRKLAAAEFSLGLESLHRFVERAPLRAIYECAFGVLALESEPIDPRL